MILPVKEACARQLWAGTPRQHLLHLLLLFRNRDPCFASEQFIVQADLIFFFSPPAGEVKHTDGAPDGPSATARCFTQSSRGWMEVSALMPVIYRAPRKNSLGWRLIAEKKRKKKCRGGLVFTRSRVKKKPQWRPITATINKEWEQMKELRREGGRAPAENTPLYFIYFFSHRIC